MPCQHSPKSSQAGGTDESDLPQQLHEGAAGRLTGQREDFQRGAVEDLDPKVTSKTLEEQKAALRRSIGTLKDLSRG
ncbi:Hypothetical protein FKW44_014879 [Caligus rogercresseyi]|uniref:Uncharacterized protein n=1 Tax=Caligus rogercresseyi TaxID=217165 RepID=A0A7T8GZT5_CALRO|nr:Hypothetical protein FKW44_014879 [Caligus rogercresseyi]